MQKTIIVSWYWSSLLSISHKLSIGYVFRLLAGGQPPEGLHAHYNIIHELGKGAFATVMKGLSKDNGQFYAIKMIQSNKLRAALTHGSSAGGHNGVRPTEQFAREIKILEHLQHPNICQLKEVFFEEANISECSLAIAMSLI